MSAVVRFEGFRTGASAPFRLCQFLCPLYRQMGTTAHSQPHATITVKLFCFSRNVENMTVVFGSAPALGAGGRRDRVPEVVAKIFREMGYAGSFRYAAV
jgi:hypothetical protein